MRSNIVWDKIKKAIDTYSMLEKNDIVLVGFSGGKDSVVLLYTLNHMSKEYGFDIKAVHVNHNIRGEEAKRDEDFCRDFCNRHKIEFISVSVNAVEYSSSNKIGLEEGARILRYNAFENVSDKYNITKIATAHTASDNMETVLFNLSRGSSAEGLRGIPPVRNNIIRPLIYCTTEEILDFANEYTLSFVTDSTNLDTDYTRNHIRHKIVPLLKEINPKAENAFSNMSDSVRQDVEFINDNVKRVSDTTPNELSKLSPAVLNRFLLSHYKEKAKHSQLSSSHISDMSDMIKEYVSSDCREEKRLSLPERIEFVCSYNGISFKTESNVLPLSKHVLHMGENYFEETGDTIWVSEEEIDTENNIQSKNIYKKYIHTVVKKPNTLDTIFVRGKQDGDVFKFSNMTKKVKKMLNEAKIPLERRESLPMFCDGKGIFWIPDFPLRDDMKPNGNKNILHLYYATQENTNE